MRTSVGMGEVYYTARREKSVDTPRGQCYFCNILLFAAVTMQEETSIPDTQPVAAERQIMDILYQRRGRRRRRRSSRRWRMRRLIRRCARSSAYWRRRGMCGARNNRCGMCISLRRRAMRPAASALRHVIATFFDGSVERTVSALFDLSAARLTPEDLERMQERIDRARKESKR